MSTSQTRPPVSETRHRGHTPALDGLRGLAIILVLAFHLSLITGDTPMVRMLQKLCGFGWIGVDLFFVLSGFLITGILYAAKTCSARQYFVSFYARRTVRIFPLYFAFLTVFLLLVPAVLSNHATLFGVPPCGAWAYWLYVYNLFQGPHDPETFSSTLGVTWSLCIEEQFYLVWPLIVFLCSPRAMFRICAGLVVVSLISRWILVANGFFEYAISHWTFCRMEGLATGAAIALVARRSGNLKSLIKPAWCAVSLLVPLATLGWNVTQGSLNDDPVYRIVGYTTLAALFGAMLILTVTGSPSNPLVRVFSNPTLRMFGRYSYAIYLFNQPVKYAMVAYVFDPETQLSIMGSKIPAQLLFFALVTSITLVLAWLSWNLFEKHFLKLKPYFPMEIAPAMRPESLPMPNPPARRAA